MCQVQRPPEPLNLPLQLLQLQTELLCAVFELSVSNSRIGSMVGY
jgi:hypothetical protein